MSDPKMTENQDRIVFPVESDDFDPDIGRKRIEDLDDDWQKLAETNLGEKYETRQKLIKDFRKRIGEEKLENIVNILIGKR
jgi:hypothetical protein